MRHPSRRDWLRFGGLAGLGATFPTMVPPQIRAAATMSAGAAGFGRAKSVIVVFASGGQSQIDTWDPKPNAPLEIRGAFDSIQTAVPGTRFCEHMSQIAKLAGKLCVVRSMSHEDLDHGTAFYLSMTGRYHRRRSGNPLPSPVDHPCHGAILQRVRPSTEFVQSAIHLNGPAEVPIIIGPGQFGGFLGKGYDPLTLGDVTGRELAIPSLLPLADVPVSRLESRQSLLASVERSMTRFNGDKTALDKKALYQQAFSMLSKDRTRSAFDLSAEPEALRDRYGRNRSGQACLLARRLVEAGIPLVTVIWNHNNRGQDKAPSNTDTYGWDNHNDIFTGLKDHLLPRFDQSFSALIEDLDERGMLDETLVVCMGEFGRAPLVKLEPNFAGASPGRKHWPSVYSIVFAGAGVAPGTVVGASDETGGYPASEHFGPWDTTATMFSALGIDPHQEYKDQLNRPYRICEGKVIESIY
ncbi:MAG: DUF1501 domain-containing protein [Fuerstiella sp.]|nr:DUF1501 domain-containing protein [Fuerstiella sp.]